MTAAQMRLSLVQHYWREDVDNVGHRASALLAMKRYDVWLRAQMREHYDDLIKELVMHRERADRTPR